MHLRELSLAPFLFKPCLNDPRGQQKTRSRVFTPFKNQEKLLLARVFRLPLSVRNDDHS